ncbi:MAG: hypothetical protein IPL65_20410 [Lewinellaceae bacterium]|nr:hypothetical protein [Lewinellaceae bacterium]
MAPYQKVTTDRTASMGIFT